MPLAINPTHNPRELLSTACVWAKQGRQIALVTQVDIDGNAPYPVGTQMLVDGQGAFYGQITGGCAEQAIAAQASKAIAEGESEIQRYGLGSPFFDIRLPCGSGIDVFIDVQTSIDQITEYYRLNQNRQTASQLLQLPNAASSFTKTYYPNRRLIVLGQGPIMPALARLAIEAGYEVICVAQNQDTQDAITQLGLVSSLLSSLELDHLTALADEHTALVSLFHEHDYETDILVAALKTDMFYIGALGSKRTHAARLESLTNAGVEKTQQARVIGPVGASIGAVTPSQIAVSIVSQLIEVGNRTTSKA